MPALLITYNQMPCQPLLLLGLRIFDPPSARKDTSDTEPPQPPTSYPFQNFFLSMSEIFILEHNVESMI